MERPDLWAWPSGVTSREALATPDSENWTEKLVSHGVGGGGSGSSADPDPAGE